jgi:hypothetical protein
MPNDDTRIPQPDPNSPARDPDPDDDVALLPDVAPLRGTSPEAHAPRMSLRLSPEARAAIEKIRQLGNMDTLQEAIRRAIGEELFLMTERRAGWKVLLQKGNQYREVIFPQI